MGVLWGAYAQHMLKAQHGSSIGPGLGARGRIRPDDIRPVLSCVPQRPKSSWVERGVLQVILRNLGIYYSDLQFIGGLAKSRGPAPL